MVNKTMVVMPEARKPVICDAVKPLALPMLPLQKIIAVAADTRCMLAARSNRKISAQPARQTSGRAGTAQW